VHLAQRPPPRPHRRQFLEEYQPVTPTEAQLVQDLIDTSWRLNRIPLLEADVLNRAANPPDEQARGEFDIVDAHRLINSLSVQGHRLSRQFQKALDQLREIQADRRERERRELKEAAALLEHHKHKGLPWEPADDGFVFSKAQRVRRAPPYVSGTASRRAPFCASSSKDQVERAARRLMRQNEARHVGYVRFDMAPQIQKNY